MVSVGSANLANGWSGAGAYVMVPEATVADGDWCGLSQEARGNWHPKKACLSRPRGGLGYGDRDPDYSVCFGGIA